MTLTILYRTILSLYVCGYWNVKKNYIMEKNFLWLILYINSDVGNGGIDSVDIQSLNFHWLTIDTVDITITDIW